MSKLPLIAALLLGASAASHALTCDELKSEIDRKIQSAGVTQYSLLVTDAEQSTPGKQVGSCENGTKKITYTQTPAATGLASNVPAPSAAKVPVLRARKDLVVTECKEGFTGPNCELRAGQ